MNKQELIERLKTHVDNYELNRPCDDYSEGRRDVWKNALCLAKQLDEPQKPVVPKFVAEWFEDAKDNLETSIGYECVRAMEICKEDCNEYHQWFANSKNNPIETLIRMKDGYEVEKEPEYHVILSENTGGWKYTFLDEEGSIDRTNNKAHIPTFTEKKVKAIDERFWPFAVPVEEVVEG